jgi:hypothetical protein
MYCRHLYNVDAAENSRELLNGEEEGADYDVGVSSSNISVSTPEFATFHTTLIYSFAYFLPARMLSSKVR